MQRLSASSIVFKLRDDLPRKQGLEYLLGSHAQVMARIKGIQEYRQHHFDMNRNGLWPAVAGVITAIDSIYRIDGVEEFALKTTLSFNKQQKNVMGVEPLYVKDSVLYIALEADNQWLRNSDGHN